MSKSQLGFESCAESVAASLAKSPSHGEITANNFQRNLGWDAKKLLERAREINKKEA